MQPMLILQLGTKVKSLTFLKILRVLFHVVKSVCADIASIENLNILLSLLRFGEKDSLDL